MNYAFEASQKAYHWHKGQEYGDRDYMHHLSAVAVTIECMSSASEQLDVLVAVAYLHDILEDTSCSMEELGKSFPEEIVDAVVALTKWTGQSYDHYIATVRANPIALQVKIADTLCNLTQSTVELNKYRIRKYTKQLNLLIED